MTSEKLHRKRDSLEGFNRKRLQGTLRLKMGVTSTADLFAKRGDTWETTSGERRRDEIERNRLELHLREANLATEQRFIGYLKQRLADAGPVEPVKVNKKQLALEAKQKRTARRAGEGKFIKLSRSVVRQAALQRELDANITTSEVTSDHKRDYGHFIVEK